VIGRPVEDGDVLGTTEVDDDLLRMCDYFFWPCRAFPFRIAEAQCRLGLGACSFRLFYACLPDSRLCTPSGFLEHKKNGRTSLNGGDPQWLPLLWLGQFFFRLGAQLPANMREYGMSQAKVRIHKSTRTTRVVGEKKKMMVNQWGKSQ
jgi:hypothetical protein